MLLIGLGFIAEVKRKCTARDESNVNVNDGDRGNQL